MSVKIRLQRHGRTHAPYYHIVVADSRAPRDGKFIEKIGMYNPTSVPATIELNLDSAVNWLAKGAQPTDTCRAILSYKGALYKHHLNGGIRKGALTEEAAATQFEKWINEKSTKVDAHVEKTAKTKEQAKADALANETKVKEARAAKLAEKLAAAEAAANPVAEEVATEEEVPATEEAPAVEETPAAEETVAEAPAAEETKTEE
ncbi:MAG: 30S ribosomal protein S16 [Bacteroidota bacterium]